MGGMHLNFRILLAITLLCATNVVIAAGFRTIEENQLAIGIWYPSDTPEEQGRLGPFDVSLAFDGQIRKGVYQPVLMSHGNSGRMRNHHLTAKALADVGYIVIAPQHSADHFIGSKKTAGAMAFRIEELHRALVAVEVDPVLGMALDFTQVHALGYSLGGATVIAAGWC